VSQASKKAFAIAGMGWVRADLHTKKRTETLPTGSRKLLQLGVGE
jgi:hypothetical protein